MSNSFVAPQYLLEAFNCPHCRAYSTQEWLISASLRVTQRDIVKNISNITISTCQFCGESAVWLEDPKSHQPVPGIIPTPYGIPTQATRGKLVYPNSSPAPMPIEDLPEEIKSEYMEAREVVNISPRSAAALLRLCIQKLMPILGEKGKNINDDIASLMRKGLPIEIQKALDTLRVLGNESVHPGEIDLNDSFETALSLFNILNFIIDRMITQPKKINDLYAGLPQSQLDAISKRDKK